MTFQFQVAKVNFDIILGLFRVFRFPRAWFLEFFQLFKNHCYNILPNQTYNKRTRKAYWNNISHGGRKCYFAQHWLLLSVVRTLVNPRPQKYPLFRFTYKKDAKFNGLIYSRSKSLLFKCNCGKFPFSSTHLRTTWKGTRWSAAYPWDTLSAQLSWSGKD